MQESASGSGSLPQPSATGVLAPLMYRMASLGRPAILCLSLFFIVAGIRLHFVREHASPAPFWDQWGAEAAVLYLPFMEGRLGVADFFKLHNEHCILLTRLLCLGLFQANILWDPVLQMVANAFLHGAFAVTLFLFLRAHVLRMDGLLYWLVLLLTGLPFDHENMLAGFQSQFPLLLMNALAAIYLHAGSHPFGLRWWAGWLPLVLGVLSMGSGFFPALAVAGVCLTRMALFKEHRNRREAGACALLVVFAVVMLGLHLRGFREETAVLRVAVAFLENLSWPVGGRWGFLMVFAPFFMAAVLLVSGRMKLHPPVAVTLALTFWVCLQGAAVAVSRPEAPLSSRYLSINAMGLAAGFLWWTHLLLAGWPRRGSFLPVAAASVWIAVVGSCLWINLETVQWPGMNFMNGQRKTHVDVINTYLETGNGEGLEKTPARILPPYPDPAVLKEMLSWPALRAILPTELRIGGWTVIGPPSDTFAPAFLPHDTDAPPSRAVWGTFSPTAGESATGEMIVESTESAATGWVEIWLAGAPSPKGSSLIIQDRKGGKKIRVTASSRPGSTWQRVVVKIPYSPFRLVASDRFQDRWFAFTAPRAVGRLDQPKKWILEHAAAFVAFGVLAWIFVLSVDGLRSLGGGLAVPPPQDPSG